jgi:hypothetical protein
MKFLIITAFAACVVLAGCVTYTPETRDIRVVYNIKYVAGCTALGAVQHASVVDAVAASFVGSGTGFTDVLNQTAALHGDTVFITNVQQVAGTAYRCKA